MLKIIRSVLKRYHYYRIKLKLNINNSIVVSKYTNVYLNEGSEKSVIKIGDNVMLHGNLYSESSGVIEIGDNSSIRKNSSIWSVNNVTIKNNVIISDNVLITDNNNHPIDPGERIDMIKSGWSTSKWKWKNSLSKPVYIGNNVWIGKDVRILKGVTIGDNSIIGMASVVTKNIPSNSVACGNPAKVVKAI